MPKFLIIAAFLFVAIPVAANLRAAEPAKVKPKLDYEKLVADLVNRNPEPKTVKRRHEYHATFADNYNWEEMGRIEESVQSLIDNFDEAWPTLVKHIDDKEYCFTADVDFDSTVFQENFSVGKLCRTLLKENLTRPIHYSRGKLGRARMLNPDFIRDSKKEPDQLRKWFTEQHSKKRAFYEMQIDAGEWALKEIQRNQAQRRKLGDEEAETMAKEDKDLDIKKLKEGNEMYYSIKDAEDQTTVKETQDDIDQLKKTKKPILMKKFNWGDGTRDMIKRAPM